VQVSDVVDHDVQVGEEYGSAQLEERFCIIEPLYPTGQARVCVCTDGLQVAGSGAHEFNVVMYPESTGLPYGSGQLTVSVCIIWPVK
jgi:hypothetical protein